MANQFDDGYYRIFSTAFGNVEVTGVPYYGPNFVPVTVGREGAVTLNMWQFSPCGDNTFELGVIDPDRSNYRYPFTGVLHDKYVFGTVQPELNRRWRFVRQPQVAGDAFTIELADRPGFGWTLGDDGRKDVALGEIPSGGDLQPTQFFFIRPF